MPAIDYSQKLFSANAAAATDWGSVAGGFEAGAAAGAALKRGLKLEAGLSALADVDAALAKFLAAQVTGRAEASAHVGVQVQFPLNLFEEAGAAVRLQAAAEAAAGVEASLGLSLADFIELARGVLGCDGVPLRLFLLFLEEVDLGAGVYAKVAATAQAQAYATIVGTLRNDPARGLTPGFNIVAGAGLGLAAGGGVRLFARARFRDFARFYARAVDLAVDTVFDEGARRIGDSAGSAIAASLQAARPTLKTAFRIAFEVGELIAEQNPPQNAAGAAELADRALATAFEEAHRYLLRTFVEASFSNFRTLVVPQWRSLDAASRARAKPKRDALIAYLCSRPADPFDFSSPAAQEFWIGIIEASTALAVDVFSGATLPADVENVLTAAWCATQLLLTAVKRATRAEASVSVVGLPANTVRAAFAGPPTAPPPPTVSDVLAAGLGIARPTDGWKLEHAVAYLGTTAATTMLETSAPHLQPFLEAFRGVFGASTSAVARTMLSNIGALQTANGIADSRRTLSDFLDALQRLTTQVLDAQAMPALRTALVDVPDALLYLNDVLRPGADFALGAGADLLLGWDTGDVGPTHATEALSAVILKLLGRTLVVTADVLQDHVQRGTQGLLMKVADDLTTNGLAAKFAQVSGLPADVAAQQGAAFLRLVACSLAPYTAQERREIRGLFLQALDPLPLAADRNFLNELARDSFLPNAEAARRLVQRMYELLSERFLAFALGTLELFAADQLAMLYDAFTAATQAVEEWLKTAAGVLAEAQRTLIELDRQIHAAAVGGARALDEALGDVADAFRAMGVVSRRTALTSRLADAFVDRAEDTLESNPLFSALPHELRADAKATARAVVRGLANGLTGPIFDAVAVAAAETSDFLDDVRELDPSTDLARGVSDIVLDRIERAVRDVFGDQDPGFVLQFVFMYEVPELLIDINGVRILMRKHHVTFDLGRITLPISRLIGFLRDVIATTNGFESAIARAAGKFRTWLTKELEAAMKIEESARIASAADAIRVASEAVHGAPKDLGIMAPANGAVYRDLVPVRLYLDEATHDYTTTTIGPDRIFVYLNGQRLASGRFTLEVLAPHDVRGPLTPGSHAWSRNATLLRRGSVSSSIGVRAAFVRPERVRGVRFSFSGGNDSPRLFHPVLGGGSLKPGAKLRNMEWQRASSLAPGQAVVLRGEIGLDECVAGLNAFSVTLIGPNGTRLTRSVTFIVEEPITPPRVFPSRSPLVLPPRLRPIDPARLKPKPSPAPPRKSEVRKQAAAAKAAVLVAASAASAAFDLSAVSPLLTARIDSAGIGRRSGVAAMVGGPRMCGSKQRSRRRRSSSRSRRRGRPSA